MIDCVQTMDGCWVAENEMSFEPYQAKNDKRVYQKKNIGFMCQFFYN